MNPKELREKIAKGEIKEQTSGMALGYAQANLVILPKEYAKDFQTFCMLNPKPCPLLENCQKCKYLHRYSKIFYL